MSRVIKLHGKYKGQGYGLQKTEINADEHRQEEKFIKRTHLELKMDRELQELGLSRCSKGNEQRACWNSQLKTFCSLNVHILSRPYYSITIHWPFYLVMAHALLCIWATLSGWFWLGTSDWLPLSESFIVSARKVSRRNTGVLYLSLWKDEPFFYPFWDSSKTIWITEWTNHPSSSESYLPEFSYPKLF